jgi:hypothetical protein
MGYIEKSYRHEIAQLKQIIRKADKMKREVSHLYLNGGNTDALKLASDSYVRERVKVAVRPTTNQQKETK